MPQILVDGLTKTFRVARRRAGFAAALRGVVSREYTEHKALDGVCFTIEPGELVGYIGPNGAGKSTTIKILSGIMVPDGGQCVVMDRVPWRERLQHVARIGVVFGQRCQLMWDLPAADSFDLLRDIYRIPAGVYRRNLDELVDRLALAGLLEIPVRQLSLGQRMRCEIAASLLHAPPLLFLDEPTIGLDAVSKLAVRDFVRQIHREHGVTVILTTHDMDDIEALCQRVILIGRGRILVDGTLADLRRQVTLERRLIIEGLPAASVELDLLGARLAPDNGHRTCIYFDPAQIAPTDLLARITERYQIRDFWVEDQPIEETIARLYAQCGL